MALPMGSFLEGLEVPECAPLQHRATVGRGCPRPALSICWAGSQFDPGRPCLQGARTRFPFGHIAHGTGSGKGRPFLKRCAQSASSDRSPRSSKYSLRSPILMTFMLDWRQGP